jgi:hypothetical protein
VPVHEKRTGGRKRKRDKQKENKQEKEEEKTKTTTARYHMAMIGLPCTRELLFTRLLAQKDSKSKERKTEP